MNSEIRRLLEEVRSGGISVDEALLRLKTKPFEDVGYAKVDLHREIRQGAAEVIYGAGKTPEQICGIAGVMKGNGQERILITRLSPESAAAVGRVHPMEYHGDARIGILGGVPQPDGLGTILVATGGTSDIPVAEEAALASVLGGLADCPVIAVHTSVGYGASFGGLSALLSMLNSCASGVSVVNIDNGFGAGYLANQINHMTGKEHHS